jgi:hypothetical protein
MIIEWGLPLLGYRQLNIDTNNCGLEDVKFDNPALSSHGGIT